MHKALSPRHAITKTSPPRHTSTKPFFTRRTQSPFQQGEHKSLFNKANPSPFYKANSSHFCRPTQALSTGRHKTLSTGKPKPFPQKPLRKHISEKDGERKFGMRKLTKYRAQDLTKGLLGLTSTLLRGPQGTFSKVFRSKITNTAQQHQLQTSKANILKSQEDDSHKNLTKWERTSGYKKKLKE